MKQNRNVLKTYFETGDKPTQSEFEQLIDSYAHLNEFNFGLSVKVNGNYKNKYYHFYKANDVQFSGAGHKNVEADYGSTPQTIGGYTHILSRNILYKTLEIEVVGNIDINTHQPKIIIERYKQKKKLDSGYIKPSGFYKESNSDAAIWNRNSEYDVTSNKMTLDLKPINYFKPNSQYNEFSPSGSIRRTNSFKYSRHSKPFVPIRLKLQITIDNINYISKPVDLKIILGSAGESDAINFIFN